MNTKYIYMGIYLLGVIIAAISQIMLKKSANKTHGSVIKEYLNPKVITAYGLFFLSSLASVLAFKEVPLSMGPILGATEYIFIAVLGYLMLGEKVGKRKIIGLAFIVAGVLVCSFKF